MIFTLVCISALYICLLWFSPPRYVVYLPSFRIYPNNEEEAKKVEQETKTINYFDIAFFKKTDPSISYAFHAIMPQYSVGELDHTITQINPIVLFFKYTINRARPKQINPSIQTLDSTTAHTPSYPAGHALQAYYLANVLGKKHPEKKNELNALAKKCDEVRVKAGLHYPSDGRCSKKIADFIGG